MLGRKEPAQSCVTVGQSHLSHVRVGVFGVDAPVLLHILEGVGHVAPSTAIVLRHTVHQVLGTQVQEFASFLLELALQGAHRAESPAGATLTLRAEQRNYQSSPFTLCFPLPA